VTTPSTSPESNTFQKQNYILRALEQGESLDDPGVIKIIELYDSLEKLDAERFMNPEWQSNNLEWDLRTTDWILEKVRKSKVYAQNLYAALCNNEFIRLDVIEVLADNRWSCSWRSAGGIVANMRVEGDYIDWYCSGMGGLSYDPDEGRPVDYVPEATVTDEIKKDLRRLGWAVISD
jgi:hypothetical protein